ncbi:hypothetical protein DFJ58DRAFT_216738 [Suillus subalutaceus]|uniref:uncharacterized protein n=1 Tax=Suillus subalutaceus TaxID=48586 RepID=UPI001B87827B|nr:uncharacterized protein DFJ58DRAFT_216738 [Suillus subalutaceus]KAG1834646.1 hypothetical protein DFJ58DRAFT_216738 [Suillus subalutaceus]
MVSQHSTTACMSGCWWKGESIVTVLTGRPMILSITVSPAQQASSQNIPIASSDAVISRFAPYWLKSRILISFLTTSLLCISCHILCLATSCWSTSPRITVSGSHLRLHFDALALPGYFRIVDKASLSSSTCTCEEANLSVNRNNMSVCVMQKGTVSESPWGTPQFRFGSVRINNSLIPWNDERI